MMTNSAGAGTGRRDRATIISFVAGDHRSGRTSIVANLAWAIASCGHDVLVLDWDYRGTSVHRYLDPFLMDELEADDAREVLGDQLAQAVGEAIEVGTDPSAGATRPVLRRYGAGGIKPDTKLDVVEHRATPRYGGLGEDDIEKFTRLRTILVEAAYDYVLIDGPPPSDDIGAVRDGRLADRVVLCFPAQARAAGKAAQLAIEIVQESPVRARILAVPTFVDDSDPVRATDQAEEARTVIVRGLRQAGFPIDDETLRLVPVPFHTMREMLVPVVFDRDEREPLLDAYQHLLGEVTGGRITALPVVSAAFRDRYRAMLGRRGGAIRDNNRPVDLVYCSVDRPWADWAAGELKAVGLEVRPLCADSASQDTPAGAVVVVGAAVPAIPSDAADVVVLRVAPGAPPIEGAYDVDLFGCSGPQARWRLLASLAESGDVLPGDAGKLPAADADPRAFELPESDVATVHRAQQFEEIRDAFANRPNALVLLRGPGGSGKTELAKAYARRYAHKYELIWMVSAHDRHAARTQVIELARQVGAEADDDQVGAALDKVAEDYAPYLLIYDDVVDSDTLRDLLPRPGTGHVLLTAREPAADRLEQLPDSVVIEVPSLTPEEGRQTLRAQLDPRDLAEEDLDAVLAAVGTEPLALRLSAGCIRIAGRRLRTGGLRAAEASGTAVERFLGSLPELEDPPRSRLIDVARSLLQLLEGHAEGRAVATFALMCAHLAHDGTSLRLVRSTPFLDQLIAATADPAPALRAFAGEVEVVMATAAQAELVRVDWGSGAQLHMHALIQTVLCEVAGEERAADVRRRTMLALAAYAPNEAQYFAGERREELAELARHIGRIGAYEEYTSVEVRRWVAIHLNSVANSTDIEQRRAAAELAGRLRKAWAAALGPDPLTTKLATYQADLLRSVGENTAALETDLNGLDEWRASSSGGELNIAINRRGTAGDLRGVGAFDLALTEDRAIYRTLTTMLGPQHQQTLRARHNLALSSYLAGRQQDAALREDEVHRLRKQLFGEGDLMTWWSAVDLAIYRRELGDLTGSRQQLVEAEGRLRAIGGDDHPLVIKAVAAQAAAERRQGRPGNFTRARALSSRAGIACRKAYGRRSLTTQAVRLSMAIDLALTGEGEGLEIAAEALTEFRRNLQPDHPFVAICLLDLGLIRRAAGQHQAAAEAAGQAAELFDDQLGAAHPWTLAAQINEANAVATCGDLGGAADRYRRMSELSVPDLLPVGHPYRALIDNNSTHLDEMRTAPTFSATSRLVDIDVEIPST
jgi:Mrp family chromosome partitioning ATPase